MTSPIQESMSIAPDEFCDVSDEISIPDPIITPSVFFDRKCLDQNKKKTKPVVYEIHLCSKCRKLDSDTPVELEFGAWSALIVQYPQDMNPHDTQTTYMISGVEESPSHIRIRLLGVKECLEWITATSNGHYESVEATLYSNDVFVVNTLREWIPKWIKTDFRMDKNEYNERRPNFDILQDIARISTGIKFQVRWLVDKINNMASLSKRVDELLSTKYVQ